MAAPACRRFSRAPMQSAYSAAAGILSRGERRRGLDDDHLVLVADGEIEQRRDDVLLQQIHERPDAVKPSRAEAPKRHQPTPVSTHPAYFSPSSPDRRAIKSSMAIRSSVVVHVGKTALKNHSRGVLSGFTKFGVQNIWFLRLGG